MTTNLHKAAAAMGRKGGKTLLAIRSLDRLETDNANLRATNAELLRVLRRIYEEATYELDSWPAINEIEEVLKKAGEV